MCVPKIKDIKVFPDQYTIVVLFDNKIIREINFTKKIEEDFYCDLKNKVLFSMVTIDAGGYGLSWNDDIDISEYELYHMPAKILDKF